MSMNISAHNSILLKNRFNEIISSMEEFTNIQASKLSVDDKHNIRTLTLRLRMLLKLMKDVIPHSRYAYIMKRLNELKNNLGKLRELEVAIADAAKYGLNDSKLKSKIKVTKKKVRANIGRGKRKDALKSLRRIAKIIRHQEIPYQKRMSKLKQELTYSSKKKTLRKEEFHGLRIKVKKTRYILEAFKIPHARIVHFQDQLGRLHDIEVLQKFLIPNSKILNDEKKQIIQINKNKNKILGYALAQIKKGSV
jgi:CHAD domain-containing protein